MNRKVYTEPKTLVKYDDSHYMAYLNEEIVENYVPDGRDGEEASEPVTGYAYVGTEPDGGTLIVAAGTDRDSLINGIIRSRYTQTEEDAIKTHQIIRLSNPECNKAGEYEEEWNTFCTFRENAIRSVDRWFE